MLNKFRKAAWLLRNHFRGYDENAHTSYSQGGEDMVVRSVFERLTINHPRYLDIGANDPFFLSNSATFYMSGASGVAIEPNPTLADKFSKARKRDAVINAGVGWDDRSSGTFFHFDPAVLSTFDPEAAEEFEAAGHRLLSQNELPLIHINDILETYFSQTPLNLLSLDIEGGESQVLNALDFVRFRPQVIIVETWKAHFACFDSEIEKILAANEYESYAQLKPNEIFLDRRSAAQL